MLNNLFLFIILINSMFLNAQYHPLIDENKTWVFNTFLYDTRFGNVQEQYDFFYFKGDTLLDGIKYNKLYSKQFNYKEASYYSNSQLYGLPYIEDRTIKKPILQALLREDIISQQVFYREFEYNYTYIYPERLWFDFKIKQDDEVINGEFNIPNIKVNISDIELLNNEFRKQIYYNYTIENRIIEGIGSIYGFKTPHWDYPIGDGFYWRTDLICVYNNKENLYGKCDQPDYVNNSRFINDKKFEFIIYPNPVKDKLIVDINSRTLQEINIEIYNANGKLIQKVVSYDSKIIIDIANISSGIYFVKISNSKEIIGNQKFIKH
jgi:hypothetical protein